MRELIRRLRYLLCHRRHDAELAEEIAFHRSMTEQELGDRGVDRQAAHVTAQRRLGNDLLARNHVRDVWIGPWFQDVGYDVRMAVRLLVKNRWFTGAAVLALALGIGANTAVFTLVNAITWRGLPVDEPDRIVRVYAANQGGRLDVSYPELRDWRGATHTFVGLAGMSSATVNIGDPGRAPDRVNATYVSWNTFRLLGDRPVLGRDFLEEDDRPGSPAVIILGYRVWRDRYGSDATVIGRAITVNSRPAIVIGVMADEFQFPALNDVWQPLVLEPGVASERRDARTIRVFGRLANDASASEATAELNSIADRLAADYPSTNQGIRVGIEPFTGTATEPFLLAMYGAVAFVLFIACANVASLLMARASHRTQEVALRGALGASRWRVVRQLLVESLAMAVLAAGLGLLFGKLGMLLMVGDTDARGLAYWVRWTMDARVYAFVAAIAVVTFILFGVGPALFLSRGIRGDALKNGNRTSTAGARTRGSTSALLVTELALTFVLLTGAGLMIRSLLAMQARDFIIDSSRLLTAGVTPFTDKYPQAEQRAELFRRLEARLRAVPILASATLTSNLPFMGAPSRRLSIEGRDEGVTSQQPIVLAVAIGGRYFETLGLRLLRGRPFTEIDGTAGHDSVIINEAFRSRFFANRDPLGQRIRLTNPRASDDGANWMTIVGVAPTIRQQPQQQTVDAVAYLPFQTTLRTGLPANIAAMTISLIVRTDAEPAALAGTLRDELRHLDSDLAVSRIVPLEHDLRQSQWTHRVFSRIFTVFAGVALVLSAVGLYAITAYAVSRRTQEIGVRIALGARRRQVVWLFAREAIARLSIGLVLGLAGAFGLGTLLRGLLVQTSPAEPAMLAIAVTSLLVAAVAATFIPARRAMRLDPVAALRHE